MHNNSDSKGKCSIRLAELISRIGRLRKKLISLGYSVREVVDIIFQQFLRLPEIDWSRLHDTKNFYELKSKFRAGSSSAEIILRLQKIVPNLHTSEVCEYLLTVLEVNAQTFGFNLADSSGESNDSGSGMHRLGRRRIRRHGKHLPKKEQVIDAIRKEEKEEQEGEKRVHHDLQYSKRKKENEQMDILFKTKLARPMLQLEDFQLEKEMKKMPQSEDSDNNT